MNSLHENSPQTRRDPLFVRILLIGVTVLFFVVFLFLPLGMVFFQALSRGVAAYWSAVSSPDALSAIGLTLLVTAFATPLNAIFGVAAAYAITKFEFRGKSLLTTLIDLPFAISPVVAGLLFVLYLGAGTPLGSWLGDLGIKVIFSVPGIVLATTFVTFPFVARELIPLMQAQGSDEEAAATTLGARGWQIFFRVTLPNIRWGLLYGMVLCNARAMGEFGAVSVLSGHIRGQTNTIPLHVEVLYSSYDFAGAFAVASVLVFLSLVSLAIKSALEHRFAQELKRPQEDPS